MRLSWSCRWRLSFLCGSAFRFCHVSFITRLRVLGIACRIFSSFISPIISGISPLVMRVLISLAVSGLRLRFFSRQALQCFEMVVKRVVALGCLSKALVCARFSLRLNSSLGLVWLHRVQVLVFMMGVNLLGLCELTQFRAGFGRNVHHL